jgi:hypothetical protein
VLVHFGVNFREGKFDETFIYQGRSGDRVGIRYTIMFQDFSYKFFLR